MARRIGILMTTVDPSDFARRHPDDGAKFRALMGPLRPDWEWPVWPVRDGVFPEGLAGHDGFLITGSPASVNDTLPWIGRLMDLIRNAVADGVPLVGVCFGHQAIAKALGGTVGPNPGGFVLGVERTETVATAPWMEPARAALRLYAAHGEQVTALPPGAEVLSRNAACPVGSFRIGTAVFTTEYHPEMDPAFMAGLAEELDGRLPANVIERARREADAPTDGAVFGEWACRFLELRRDGPVPRKAV